MNYWKLRYDIKGKQECRRVSGNIKRLRKMLADTIPTQTTDKNLILGTWNIRNFDDNRFGHGPRLTESLFYLAEIINAFDVIAVQEVCDDIGPLKELMDVLGNDYDFIFTDVTEGRGGNKERLGFIYNKRKVYFKGIAGEIVLPDKLLISAKNKLLQFSRTPFSVEFQSGWFKFNFATVHIYYGKSSKKSLEYKQRVNEIQTIANFLAKRSDKESIKYGVNYVLVGDFNIDALGDNAYNALEKAGFKIYQNRTGSNKNRTKFYDQISFKERPGEVMLSPSVNEKEQHGVFDAFKAVFRDEDFNCYDKEVIKKLNENRNNLKNDLAETTSATKRKRIQKKMDSLDSLINNKAEREQYYLKEWRTFQISDHLPLWVDLQVDFTDKYLDRVFNE